jgi:O-acetylhomoserine/O-acetylserine sulfhydrylase-like pyridoxal-dependent enzyme
MSTQKFATNVLHAGHDVQQHAGTRAVPIYQTTSYVFNNSENAANLFLNALKMCSLSANLGDTRTIVTHPASTTHTSLAEEDRLEVGITDGLVRISVGLEHQNDIMNDLKQALEHV